MHQIGEAKTNAFLMSYRYFLTDEKVCPVCGASFPRNHNQKYCSPQCSRIGKRRGTFPLFDLRRRRNGITDKQKQLILERYKQCPCCGWSAGRLQIHHILPVCKGGDNSIGNLIALCPNCHQLADRGSITNKALLSKQIAIESFYADA